MNTQLLGFVGGAALISGMVMNATPAMAAIVGDTVNISTSTHASPLGRGNNFANRGFQQTTATVVSGSTEFDDAQVFEERTGGRDLGVKIDIEDSFIDINLSDISMRGFGFPVQQMFFRINLTSFDAGGALQSVVADADNPLLGSGNFGVESFTADSITFRGGNDTFQGERVFDANGGTFRFHYTTDAPATEAVPEPLTILGTMVATGMGVAARRRQLAQQEEA